MNLPNAAAGKRPPARIALEQTPTLACWHLVLEWLLADPLLTGQQALQRLEREQPGLYGGSLRTLQRRLTGWRVANAEQVVSMQMEAFQEQESNQLNRKEKPRQR